MTKDKADNFNPIAEDAIAITEERKGREDVPCRLCARWLVNVRGLRIGECKEKDKRRRKKEVDG